VPHAGSVSWNPHRRRWVLIAVEQGGTSFLGEVWYAEADTPVGPWLYAVKVATHDRYSFYNPKQHPAFDRDGGRVIFFEGTYSNTFSGNPVPTPRYDYNQLLYKLDLADPRLALPAPVYDVSTGEVPEAFAVAPPRGKEGHVAFLALDRPLRGTVPILVGDGDLHVGKRGEAGAIFHALPAGMKDVPPTATPLYEYRQGDGRRRAYSVSATLSLAGFARSERPLCYVWKGR
jgi:hypothetical protein